MRVRVLSGLGCDQSEGTISVMVRSELGYDES